MLRVIVVDDEPLGRQAMRQLLAAHSEIQIIAEADGVRTATALIQREKPDALFLDIRMPGANGFDLLHGLNPIPRVIFVTAYSEHAVRAFEVDAVDYLLKPVRPERLAIAIRRLRSSFPDAPAKSAPQLDKSDRVCLRTPERTIIAPLNCVAALEAHGDFVKIHFTHESPMLICQTLAYYERTLPSPPFLRLSRSLMIHRERIDRIDTLSRDESRLWLRDLSNPFTLGRAATTRARKVFSP